MLTKDKLRQIADDYNRKTELQRAAEKAAESAAARAKADAILAQIDARMLAEASCGRTHAVIMGLKSYTDTIDQGQHWSHGSKWGYRLEPGKLKGAAALVYQGCVERDLEPTLEYWFDGCDKDGFNIVVHW